MSRLVTFLTDYGHGDEFAGACRAVIARLAPGAPVVDLTHGIPAGDVRRGALALAAAAPYAGSAVHLAVVDPGVGTERRALALETAGPCFLVGPDNGLLALAAEALGGVVAAADISRSALRAEPVAPTFHGRDLFAPVAAHLACERPLAAAGEAIDPGSLAALELPVARVEGDELIAHVLYADGFGNVVLDAGPPLLPALPGSALSVTPHGGKPARAVRGRTFADAEGGLVVYEDSSGHLGVALEGGSAAEALGIARDDELAISAR